MRALDTSDPSDPRGFQHQANIHCHYCGHGAQVHGSWQFFAWHRAYLYFHERILGKLIGDMDFRLPYWSWEVPSNRKIPSAYTSPNDASNPLWNGTRGMTPADEIPDEDVNNNVMEAALTATDFAEFGGTAGGSGIPEGAPHGSVHVDVGGDMGAFATAGRDPVFYAHHSNVDKMWSDWNKSTSTHTNPTDPAFLNLSWTFFDENKVWRSITAAQVLNHENQLRYIYGPSTFRENLACLLDWGPIVVNWAVRTPLKIDPPMRRKVMDALERGGLLRLRITDLAVPVERSAVYRIYSSPAAAEADKGPETKEFLGTFPVVLNDPENQHKHKGTTNVALQLSKATIESLLSGANPLDLSFVERTAKKEGTRKVMPVRAKEIQLALADVER